MDDVDRLLRMPDEASERESAWVRLTTGSVLLEAMRRAVNAGPDELTSDGWFRHLDRWMTHHIAFANADDITRMLPQWRMAKRVVWCGRRALTGLPDRRLFRLADAHHRDCVAQLVPWAVFERSGLLERIKDDETRAIMDYLMEIEQPHLTAPPEAVTRYEAWTWHCIAWLRSVESRSAEVPVAVYVGDSKARLATLVVEVVEHGAGQGVPHPEDTFAAWPLGRFHESMRDAFSGAVDLFTRKNGARPLCDGRFRLRWRGAANGDDAIPAPDGRSASGAAALAFYHALHTPATYPDPYLIVMARVSEDDSSRLAEVGNVTEKTRAVVEAYKAARSPLKQIDTIVVTSLKNKQEAEAALAEAATATGTPVDGWPIRVVIAGQDAGGRAA